MNPFTAIGDFVLGWLKDKKFQAWLVLLFQLAFSACVTFLYTTGGVLAALPATKVPLALGVVAAIGMGMLSAATVMVVIFRRSPATKGMLAVLPAGEANDELNSNLQVIERGK